jgi:hypothetical protein
MLPVVTFMTPVSILLVMDWFRYGSRIQHLLKALNMRVDLFIIFWQVGGDLINEHPSSQGVLGWHMVNLVFLILDPTDFLTD